MTALQPEQGSTLSNTRLLNDCCIVKLKNVFYSTLYSCQYCANNKQLALVHLKGADTLLLMYEMTRVAKQKHTLLATLWGKIK